MLGTIKIGNINKFSNTADVSYLIGNKNFWRKGIGTYVLQEILLFSFIKLKIIKIFAGCYSSAIASQKILLRNGFKLEFISKNQINFENKKINHFIYSVDKNNFFYKKNSRILLSNKFNLFNSFHF